MQLTRGARPPGPALAGALAVIATWLALAPSAAADGQVSVRGAYYKERATRVEQPMIDAQLDVGDHGQLQAHTLVDSISSASVAAGATGTPFNEKRYELGASYLHALSRFRLGGGGRLSVEPDYTSVFVNLEGQVDLGQRTTTLALSLAGGRDRATNAGSQNPLTQPISGILHTAMSSVSLTQVLTPVLVGQLTYDLVYLDGYQENPYRSVSAGGSLEPERVPDTRVRHAAQVTVRGFVPRTRTTLVGSYRFYADSWGVVAHTPGIRAIQEIIPDLDVTLSYRYYHQSGADFYQPIYDSADPAINPYLTDDAKLSRMGTQTFGVRLDTALHLLGVRGRLAQARAEALLSYITQTAYYGNAVSAELALTVPFTY